MIIYFCFSFSYSLLLLLLWYSIGVCFSNLSQSHTHTWCVERERERQAHNRTYCWFQSIKCLYWLDRDGGKEDGVNDICVCQFELPIQCWYWCCKRCRRMWMRMWVCHTRVSIHPIQSHFGNVWACVSVCVFDSLHVMNITIVGLSCPFLMLIFPVSFFLVSSSSHTHTHTHSKHSFGPKSFFEPHDIGFFIMYVLDWLCDRMLCWVLFFVCYIVIDKSKSEWHTHIHRGKKNPHGILISENVLCYFLVWTFCGVAVQFIQNAFFVGYLLFIKWFIYHVIILRFRCRVKYKCKEYYSTTIWFYTI